MTIEWIHPDELRNHPTNISIYGDTPDPELVESVRKYGVFPDHPIGYVMDGEFRTIVSGHRRNQAAKMTKQDMVPVVHLKDLEGDPLAIEERIILSNKQRVKTREQLAKEAAHLIDIEARRATERMTLGVDVPLGSESGRAREKVAESLGVSDKTARNLITAGKALEDAKSKGQTKRVERIQKGLEKSAAAGAKAAEPKPPKNGSVIPPKFDEKKLFDTPLGAVRRSLDLRLAAFPGTDRLFNRAKYALNEFLKIVDEWRSK